MIQQLEQKQVQQEMFMEYMDSNGYMGPYSIEIEYTEDFCMRDKKPEDLDVANQAVQDSYDYLKSIGRI